MRKLKRNIFQRIIGKPATNPPKDPSCWKFKEGRLTVDIAKTPELSEPGTGVRFEGENLPKRVLLVRGDDNEYYAFCNQCTHGGRRLDPVPGGQAVQCCSLGKSTFDYKGNLKSGAARDPLTPFTLVKEGNKIIISVD